MKNKENNQYKKKSKKIALAHGSMGPRNTGGPRGPSPGPQGADPLGIYGRRNSLCASQGVPRGHHVAISYEKRKFSTLKMATKKKSGQELIKNRLLVKKVLISIDGILLGIRV